MIALRRRAIRELTRRKARSAFTILTIGAAVVGLWLFAVPILIDGAMTDRAEQDLLWDLRFSPDGIELTENDVDSIRDLPSVAGVEPRVLVWTPAREQRRVIDVLLVGVDDFADQEVNVVSLIDGALPAEGEVLADAQNTRTGRTTSGIGDELSLGGFPVRISGTGSTLEWGSSVDDDRAVFYLPLERLQAAIDFPGISWLDIRVTDPTTEGLAAAEQAVRQRLAEIDPEVTYTNPMRSREPGTWPEQDQVENIVQLMYVIAVLGLISAVLMVSTTMNTVTREQTREIGIIKAVGGSRGAVVRAYLLTTVILGAFGTLIGIAAGIPLANLLVGFAGRQFSGVEAAFSVPIPVLLLSLFVGIAAPIAAGLPAIVRASRMSVREALVDHGMGGRFGGSAFDRALTGSRFLPRTLVRGIRDASRNKTRSVSTGIQVGFAVGTFLGFLTMGITVLQVSEATFEGEGGDILVEVGAEAGDVLSGVPGIATAAPVAFGSAAIGGEVYQVQAQGIDAIAFHDVLRQGRWFTPEEEAAAARVAVIGPALANKEDLDVGDVVTIETNDGLVSADVIGITSLMVNDGQVLYVPISAAPAIIGESTPEAYYVATTGQSPVEIDATAVAIDTALREAQVPARVSARYVERDASESQNRVVLAILMVLGIPVIAIGMIGLVNTMTMNVVERTREIGVLRSLGARARHVRRSLRSEALVVATLGWLAAIPLGFAIGTVLINLLSNAFGVDFALTYPAWPLPIALVATLVVTAIVVRLPARRAVRLPPGAALRYE